MEKKYGDKRIATWGAPDTIFTYILLEEITKCLWSAPHPKTEKR